MFKRMQLSLRTLPPPAEGLWTRLAFDVERSYTDYVLSRSCYEIIAAINRFAHNNAEEVPVLHSRVG